MFVYVIVNSESLKLYIGQHKGNNLRKYLQTKLSNAKRNSGARSHLLASMRKHPKDVWSIHPLMVDLQTRVECDEWERHYIKVLKSQHLDVGYNICEGGEGFTGKHSEASRQKMRKKVQSFYDAGGQAGATGTKHTEEWKQEASRRRKGRIVSDATRQKTAATLMGHEVSDTVRNRLRELGQQLVGEKNPFFGRHHSAESKRKNAEAHRKPWSAARREAYERQRLLVV
jgi:Straboviridae intron-associated endonuclease 1